MPKISNKDLSNFKIIEMAANRHIRTNMPINNPYRLANFCFASGSLPDNIEMKTFVIKNLTSKKNELWLAFSKEKEINDALRTKISKFDLIFRQIYDDFKQDK